MSLLMSLPAPLDCWFMWIEAHPWPSIVGVISLVGAVKLYYELPKLRREKSEYKRERKIEAMQRKIELLEGTAKRDKGFSVSLTSVVPEMGEDPNIVAEAWRRFQKEKRANAVGWNSRLSRARF